MLVEKETLKIDQVDWLKDHIELYTSRIKDQFLVKLYKNEAESLLSIYSFLKNNLKEKQGIYLLRILPFVRQDKKLNKLKEKKAIRFTGEFSIRNFSIGEKNISFCLLYRVKNLAEFEELEIEMNKINSYFLCSSIELANSLHEKVDSSVFHSVNESINIVNTVKLLLLLERGQSLLKQFPKDKSQVYFFTNSLLF